MKLKLEIEFEEGSRTCVEKEFDSSYAGSQFDSVFNELAYALISCGISKSYIDVNLDYLDNPKNEQHVYCTECFYWDKLSEAINDFKEPVPTICKNCYPYDPEDSTPLSIRKNYSKA